jgi:uncharacterized protein with FMN-binding domain
MDSQSSQPQIPNKTGSKPFALSALILLPLILIGYFVFGKKAPETTDAPKTDTPVNPNENTNTPNTTDATNTPAIEASYKDGTYTARGAYASPAGPEEYPVSITLKDGIITAVKVTPSSTNEVSTNFQTQFSKNVQPIVIGKSINEVKLDKVSGSSLTPKGFNDAVEKIKAQART